MRSLLDPIFGKGAVTYDTDWHWMIEAIERTNPGQGTYPGQNLAEPVKVAAFSIEQHCRQPHYREAMLKAWTTRRFLVRPEGYVRVRASPVRVGQFRLGQR